MASGNFRIAFFTAILFAIFIAPAFAEDKAAKTSADVLGGEEVVGLIAKADTVEVYRLKDQFHKEKSAEYEASAGPLKVDAKTAQELAAVLTAFDSYQRGFPKGCEPIFGVRTTFTHAKKGTVDIVYCFSCDILAVYHNGKYVGSADFDPARPDLIRLAKRMLPKDDEIGKLK